MKKFDKVDWMVLLIAAGLLALVMRPGAEKPAEPASTTAAAAAAASPAPAAEVATPQGTAPAAGPTAIAEEKTVVLKNPAGEYTFSTYGGGIRNAHILPGQYAGKTPQDVNVRPLGPIGGLAQGKGEIDNKPWNLVSSTDTSVTFETTMGGMTVQKVWTMKAGALDAKSADEGPGYLWDLNVKLTNTGAAKITTEELYLYTGAAHRLGAISVEPEVSAVRLADGRPVQYEPGAYNAQRRLWVLWETQPARPVIEEAHSSVTWAGTASQYYVSLISPTDKGAARTWSKLTPDEIVVAGKPAMQVKAVHTGLGLGMVQLEPQATVEKSYEVFVGPRSATLLGKVGGERQDAMFYGMTGIISRLFLWMLNMFNGWTSSFGLAIVFLTIVVRFAIWPLSLKAYFSMKKMGKLGPMMAEIKERYKNLTQSPENARKQQMEIMGLYREYQVSPVGGCLPVLLQMPIFFGYFGMLNHAVEMRGHSFLWANDLSLPDTVFHIFGFPLNPLPLVMTATMYLQMKLTPMQTPSAATSDTMAQQMAMQQKMFKFMPVFFLLFCYSNPSALALYWTVQNIVSIFQSYVQKLMPEPELQRRATKLATGMAGAEAEAKAAKIARVGGGAKSAYKKD